MELWYQAVDSVWRVQNPSKKKVDVLDLDSGDETEDEPI